jgi:predicted nucleic acid-binding protein
MSHRLQVLIPEPLEKRVLAKIDGGPRLMLFVDSNIPMYVAGRDHPLPVAARRPRARARSDLYTSTEVLQAILYRYAALKRLGPAANVYGRRSRRRHRRLTSG